MFAVSLILVGISLIMNGFSHLFRWDKKFVAEINFAVGGLVVFFNLYQITTSTSPSVAIDNLGGFLFGLTNLFVAFSASIKTSAKPFGWYCLLSTIIALSLSGYYFFLANLKRGIIWIVWSLIWLFAFIGYGPCKNFRKASNVMFIVQGILTTGLLGILILFGIIAF